MEPKLLRTEHADYEPAEFTGKNKSGCWPLGDRVLILPDRAVTRTVGGIELPDELVHRHALAAEAGIVAAVGDGAFKWNQDRATPYAGRTPHVGERVVIERYAGQLLIGDDGQRYRIMESASIGAIITPDKEKKHG